MERRRRRKEGGKEEGGRRGKGEGRRGALAAGRGNDGSKDEHCG